MLAAFEEFDKILRIFDLGEIEQHLKSLDRTNPESLAEIQLILAFHKSRLDIDEEATEYFNNGISLAASDANFEQRPFYETYEAILYFLIFKKNYSKEDKLDAYVRIFNMDARTKIQKYIKCSVYVDGLIMGYTRESVDFISASAEYCSPKDELDYLPYLGAAMHGQDVAASFEERKRYFEKLAAILNDDLADTHARLEIAIFLAAGSMAIAENDLSLEATIILNDLIAELELENTHLHFVSLFLNAGISGLWGNKSGYQHFTEEAEKILTLSGNKRKYLEELGNELLGLVLGYGVGEEVAYEILVERWRDFHDSYDGTRPRLSQWHVAITNMANHLYNRGTEFSEEQAVELLKSFIVLHDQSPKNLEQYIVSEDNSEDYSEDTLILFEMLNNTFSDYSEAFEVMPFIYAMHLQLGNFESYRGNEKIAERHYKLAWERLPNGLKLKSEVAVRLLGNLLDIFQDQENYQEAYKTALHILDIMEQIIFASDDPFAVQRFEGPDGPRHHVIMAMYEILFAWYRYQEDSPSEVDTALSDAFRGLQIARANRLTKFFKMQTNEAAKKDIIDLKKYLTMSEALGEISATGAVNKMQPTQALSRDYNFFDLKKIQSQIPWDTIMLVAYESDFNIHFALINSYWFDPMISTINKNELSKHMNILLKSFKNGVPIGQFDYESASWIYSEIFGSEADNKILDETVKNIVFLPSKTMFNFPISLLHNGQERLPQSFVEDPTYDPSGFLIDDYYISYAVNFSEDMFVMADEFSLLVARHKPVTSKSFFALADPSIGNKNNSALRGINYIDIAQPNMENLPFESLPETLEEVNAAAEYFTKNTVNILSGAAATKENILSATTLNSDVLMFSTHGVSPGVIPGYDGSGLLLSLPNTPFESFSFEDILLTPDDVLGLSLDSDIVILNACNSGISDIANAPGLTGLAQSFLAAGSDAVMVSHWPISSATTVKITKRMFENIQKDPKTSFNRALTDAQLSIKADPKTQHPFYWAPYNIYGNF